jgi:hypothetical protein
VSFSTAMVSLVPMRQYCLADKVSGSRFAVTMLVSYSRPALFLLLTSCIENWYPTIYSVSDSNPIAICTGENRPDGSSVPAGERGYSNSCTMKVRAQRHDSPLVDLGTIAWFLWGTWA